MKYHHYFYSLRGWDKNIIILTSCSGNIFFSISPSNQLLTFLSPRIIPLALSTNIISRIFIRVNPGILIKFSNYVKLSKIMQTCQFKISISTAKC